MEFGEFDNNQIESAGTIILSRTQKLRSGEIGGCCCTAAGDKCAVAILYNAPDQLDAKTILSAMEKVSLPIWPMWQSTRRRRLSTTTWPPGY